MSKLVRYSDADLKEFKAIIDDKATSPPPIKNEDDLILEIEDLPEEMLPPSEEGFDEM